MQVRSHDSGVSLFHAAALIEDAKALVGQGYGPVLPLLLDGNGELYTPLRKDGFGRWFGAARTETEVDALFRQYGSAIAGIALGIERTSKFVAARSAQGVDPFNRKPGAERIETVSVSEPAGSVVHLFQRDSGLRPVPKLSANFAQVEDLVIVPPTRGYAWVQSPFQCRILTQAPFQLAN